MELYNLNINDFLQRLSDKSPTPGGGSVAALNGALGASLSSMVINNTLSKKQYSRYADLMQELLTEIIQIQNELTINIQRDAEAFASITNAMSLPSNTTEEKIMRKNIIEKALKSATMVPFEIMILCTNGLKTTNKTLGKCSSSVLSELAAVAVEFNAGIKISFLNVLVNLSSIDDKEFVLDYRTKSQELLAIGDNLYREIHTHCLKQIITTNN